MGVFFIDERLKDVLNLLKKGKSPEFRYFAEIIDEYDNSGLFKCTEQLSNGTIYEGKLIDKKICGGEIGMVSIFGYKENHSISVCDKKNPINSYTLKIKEDEGSLIVESERILKTITFNIKRGLFGEKITNVKVSIENMVEPCNY